MKIKIVLILSIFLYLQFTTQDDMGIKNQIICSIAGAVWTSSYVFNIDELPERCEIIIVGEYALDRNYDADTYVMESDKNIFRTIVEANKPLYTRLGFESSDNWVIVFDPSDENEFQTKIFDPLVKFLNEFKINGLLLKFNDLFTVGIDDLATKISCFASALKEKVDKLVVGMVYYGSSYESFEDNTLFDFTITNKVMDIYVINWNHLNSCDNSTVKTGVSPITSTNPKAVTIAQITCSVTNSCMDKSKIYAIIEMATIIPPSLLPEYATHAITTYSIYCGSTDNTNSSQWCNNPSQLIYEQGKHAKCFYAGIVLEHLDADDYECKCGCGPFPVTNIAIDGWTGSTFNDCPALD